MVKETRYGRFKRLSSKRANKTIKSIFIIHNQGDSSKYSKTKKDINDLYNFIYQEICLLENKFLANTNYEFDEYEEIYKNDTNFHILINKRLKNVHENIRKIGNLSNKSNYSFEEEDVKLITHRLKETLEFVKCHLETEWKLEELLI